MAAEACLLIVLIALGYEWASLHTRWNPWRGTAFMTGCALLMIGLATPAHTFTGHMWQHLLIAMLAPLGLVLGTPVTLALRTLPVSRARQVTRLLRTRVVRVYTHPGVALVLTVGSLPLLWSASVLHHPVLQLHFVVSGCLFTWVIAGADPAPHRVSVRTRLVVLGVAIAAHATMSQLLYATGDADRQAGATVMYYGGDVAELLLAFAVIQSRRAWPRRDTGWTGRVTAPGMLAWTAPLIRSAMRRRTVVTNSPSSISMEP